MSAQALITHADTHTAGSPCLEQLWERLITMAPPESATIAGIGSDEPYRALTLDRPASFLEMAAQALDPVLPKLERANRDPRRSRPIVLVSTVTGSRPQHDLSDAGTAAPAIGNAFAQNVAAIAELLNGAAQVIGVGSGCAAGTTAVGIGSSLITSGRADFVVCLGIEQISLAVITLFTALGGLTHDGVARPFDHHRDGILPGEGWGVLVVESEQWATDPIAAVLGYGEASDGYDVARPSPEGTGLVAAVGHALTAAGCGVDQIGWVSAHGTGTRANDALEAAIYDGLFAQRLQRLPCVSIKGVTGHCLGAAGVIEAAVGCISLSKQAIPANSPLRVVDSTIEALRTVSVPRTPSPLGTSELVLSTSFGFGGSVSAVVIGQP